MGRSGWQGGRTGARAQSGDLAPTIKELQAGGCESLRAIAAGLEERGIPAARGGKCGCPGRAASPSRARKAAVALVLASREGEPSLGVLLLTHLKAVFGETEKLSTDVILKRLHEIEEAPWRDLKGKSLDDRGLARRLRQYGIKSRTVRIGEATPRGYERADFVDAWSRYIPPSPPPTSTTSATSKTSATNGHLQADSVAHVADVLLSPGGERKEAKGAQVAHPCAQCGLDDGQQKLQPQFPDSIWLHRECARFWKSSQRITPE
jgi:hypothetical protein